MRHLFLSLFPQTAELGGTVFFAPLRLRIRAGKFREPDLVLLRDAGDPRRGNDFWTGADLVVEVVSPDDPDRDLRRKRADYAEARIPVTKRLTVRITLLSNFTQERNLSMWHRFIDPKSLP